MTLLVDSDAFCKLGIAALLNEAAGVFGMRISKCGRLPALPHMLRRGSLARRYGANACGPLIALADKMPVARQPSVTALEPLVSCDAIDPGEARLFAAAAEFDCMVVSGDKRAVRALKNVESAHAALAGRIVVLEAILLRLCEQLHFEYVRQLVAPLVSHDTTVAICFSSGGPDPREGLRSYYDSLAAEVRPLPLWNPQHEDRA